jgi:hypothetical protein
MAQKVIVPQKKNYVPQFLKQRDINSYSELRKRTVDPIQIDGRLSVTASVWLGKRVGWLSNIQQTGTGG